jgi:hypothetical protein
MGAFFVACSDTGITGDANGRIARPPDQLDRFQFLSAKSNEGTLREIQHVSDKATVLRFPKRGVLRVQQVYVVVAMLEQFPDLGDVGAIQCAHRLCGRAADD